MSSSHDAAPNTYDLVGEFIPVVVYDINKGKKHFAAAYYHETDTPQLDETEQIVGYDAIAAHTHELLDDYAKTGNLLALVDATAIMETYWEFFGEVSQEQIDEIAAEICDADKDGLIDLVDESKNAPRVYQGVLREVKTRVVTTKHLDALRRDPLIAAYIDSYVADNGATEPEAVAALLLDLQKVDK